MRRGYVMPLVDALIAQVLKLEITLYHASARLASNTDGEALHDLRISVRRLTDEGRARQCY